MPEQADYDVVIVGGGPAGLSAALVLGRCRRRVLVCDAGQPRNAAAGAMHGYLSRDGVSPREFLRLGRTELSCYGVELRAGMVTQAGCLSLPANRPAGAARFEVTFEPVDPLEQATAVRPMLETAKAGRAPGNAGRGARLPTARRYTSRRLLLATGVCDELPDIPGLRELYGTVVHHCPYCDAWEHREQPLVAFGRGKDAIGLALALRTWSDRVIACTNRTRLQAGQRARAARHGIELREEQIVRLERIGGRMNGRPGARRPQVGRMRRVKSSPQSDDGRQAGYGLRAIARPTVSARVVFAEGAPVECGAFFFNTAQLQQSSLATLLGCEYGQSGQIATHGRQHTRVPGLFMAGDADGEVQFVIVAAAEGATAAVAINRELQMEDRGEPDSR